jgi:hypothetical protein
MFGGEERIFDLVAKEATTKLWRAWYPTMQSDN